MFSEEEIGDLQLALDLIEDELYNQKEFSTLGSYLEDARNSLFDLIDFLKIGQEDKEDSKEEFWGDAADRAWDLAREQRVQEFMDREIDKKENKDE